MYLEVSLFAKTKVIRSSKALVAKGIMDLRKVMLTKNIWLKKIGFLQDKTERPKINEYVKNIQGIVSIFHVYK